MEPPFTLTQLRYFVTIASAGTMTRAAERLHVSQSTLSSALSSLEAGLGVQLFFRQQARTLTLTPEGLEFVQKARVFLAHAEELAEAIVSNAHTLSGVLRVGVFAPLAPTRLPAILRECGRRHPQLEVTLVEADLAQIHRALQSGECDIALTYNLGLPEYLDFDPLRVIPPHVLVSSEHPLAKKAPGPVSLGDFADEPLVWIDLPHTREYYELIFRQANVVPRVRYRSSGYETVRAFVAAGHGYAVLNQRMGARFNAPTKSLTLLELDGDLPPITVGLARPKGARRNRRMEAFAQLCQEEYSLNDEAAG